MSTKPHLPTVDIPRPPPCFSVDSWVRFIVSAAGAQRIGKRGPILLVAGQPARFDMSFRFCQDCDRNHRSAMLQRGRCEPGWLLDYPTTPTGGLPNAEGRTACAIPLAVKVSR